MPKPRTQKELAGTYLGNLAYFRRAHPFRTLRLLLFVVVAAGSIAAAIGYRKYGGTQQFFNTGPISRNHATVECRQCHKEAETDLVTALFLDKATDTLRKAPGDLQQVNFRDRATLEGKSRDALASASAGARELPGGMKGIADKALMKSATLAHMDAACLDCHGRLNLHTPQTAALRLSPVHGGHSVVHASGCSDCHKEHVGSGVMALPASDTCVACHKHEDRMLASRVVEKVDVTSAPVPTKPEVRNLGDGTRRFIAPRKPEGVPALITSFGEPNGHPRFSYENYPKGDPAEGTLSYNHHFHEGKKTKLMEQLKNGTGSAVALQKQASMLECQSCHKPGADGVFYQRVNYEENCRECHSLNFDPEIPLTDDPDLMTIPHGGADKVVGYLRNLTSHYLDYAKRVEKIEDRKELEGYVRKQFDKMNDRGIRTFEDLGDRIFNTGDSGDGREDRRQINQCSKCHGVTKVKSDEWKVAETNVADRWLGRGPFTHKAHTHMTCHDCHGGAPESKQTADILMPTQASCAECHRGRDDKFVNAAAPGATTFTLAKDNLSLVTRQKAEGGIAFECRNCHKYHAPPGEVGTAKPSLAELSRVLSR